MKVKAGDVFEFSVNDGQVGTGQIAAKDAPGIPLYVVIFEPIYKQNQLPDVKEIVQKKIILVAGSMDARLHSGDWKVLGNCPVDGARIPFPNFKIGEGDIKNHVVETFDRKKSRRATGDDLVLYDYRTAVAPVRLEKAFNAYHLKTGWNEHYEKLRYEYVAKRCAPL